MDATDDDRSAEDWYNKELDQVIDRIAARTEHHIGELQELLEVLRADPNDTGAKSVRDITRNALVRFFKDRTMPRKTTMFAGRSLEDLISDEALADRAWREMKPEPVDPTPVKGKDTPFEPVRVRFVDAGEPSSSPEEDAWLDEIDEMSIGMGWEEFETTQLLMAVCTLFWQAKEAEEEYKTAIWHLGNDAGLAIKSISKFTGIPETSVKDIAYKDREPWEETPDEKTLREEQTARRRSAREARGEDG